jgi:hypothetical protein
MYSYEKERSVEKICYEQEHVDEVLKVIKENFNKYFNDFLASQSGVTERNAQKTADSLGVDSQLTKKSNDYTQNYKNILIQALNDFEKDRKKYEDIFDSDTLEEYQDDPSAFKSKVLRYECPIINSTLQNKRAKVLDKYRRDFNLSDANELLTVVTNLYNFAENYLANVYNADNYENIKDYSSLLFSELDESSCTVYGVIGGGIKSHMLYKVYPSVFPNRGRNSIWALWYLTNKKVINCKMDSEFLMIDIKESTTQQNYFYPYELFSFYAHQIYLLLKNEAKKLDVYIDPDYRYVVVDKFLNFIAESHMSEINVLTNQIKESDYVYM